MTSRVLHHAFTMATQSPPRRRVVVTGLGLVTCLGSGVPHVWERLLAGECGISQIDHEAYKGVPCQIAGFVPRGGDPGSLQLDSIVPKSIQRDISMATCFSLVAADEALKDANWAPASPQQQERTGVAVGMGMVPLDEIIQTGVNLQERGYKRVSPHFVPKILGNMAAGNISLQHGFQGPNHAVSTACATGAHAIGDAFRFIQNGDADVMVCGGTEACITPVAVAGFSRMRALSTSFNDKPLQSSRPFDRQRDGFVMSEGSGIVVLEELEHALSRECSIYGEIRGYGLAGDSHHITAPSSDGSGALRCMMAAMRNSNLSLADIGYINAHATSTPLGDAAEASAICRLFGEAASSICVSSTKGAVGHLLGAAGSVEAIFTILACHHGIVPPTLNCDEPDPNLGLNYVSHAPQKWPSNLSDSLRAALTNSFGFGGTNACLLVSNFV